MGATLPLAPTIGAGNRWDTDVWPRREGGLRNNDNEPWGGNVSAQDLAISRRAYFASVAFVDEQVSFWRARPCSKRVFIRVVARRLERF